MPNRRARFQAFIDQYPNSELAAERLLLARRIVLRDAELPDLARQRSRSCWQQYPNSQKAPDALLKVGYSQYELKQWDQAEATLNQVVQNYPDTTVAHLAQGRLRALKLGSPALTADGARHAGGRFRCDPRARKQRLRITEIFHSLQGEARRRRLADACSCA